MKEFKFVLLLTIAYPTSTTRFLIFIDLFTYKLISVYLFMCLFIDLEWQQQTGLQTFTH